MEKNEYIDIELLCTEEGELLPVECRVSFTRSNSGYGNDTYMNIKFRPGSFSPSIDIRYDTDYSPDMSDGQHILYALDYLINHHMRKSIEVYSVRAKIDVEESE